MLNHENEPDVAFCNSFLYSRFDDCENIENPFEISPYNWQKWEAFKQKFFRVIDRAVDTSEMPF